MIQVLQSGIQTSIQDLGRWGFQSFGIAVGGSLCQYSTSIANVLVGNETGTPVLEIVQSPHQFLFEKEALISFSGGGLIPKVNGNEIPLNQPYYIKSGSLLEIKKPSAGFRLYMAIAGGFQADEFLNSYATHFATKKGGFQGRAIQKGDNLSILKEPSPIAQNIIQSLKQGAYFKINGAAFALPISNEIRVTTGVDFDLLTNKSQQTLIKKPFSISNNSNRMGYRLDGTALETKENIEMISSAVAKGTIQLLPDGQLIALMPDCQTVGGYPKIAHIITTDISKCAQLKPSESIFFSIVSLAEAEKLLEKQNQQIKLLETLIQQHFS